MRPLPPCPATGSLLNLPTQSLYRGPELLGEHDCSHDCSSPFLCLCRSRTRGPIGPGKYGYGKAPYILPLQTDSTHSPQRLRRQRSSSRHSRSQEASGPSYGYSPPRGRAPHRGPLYQSDSGPHSGLQASEASIYQLPLTHDQGFPVASSSLHSPDTSSSHGMGAHSTALSFAQPARSAAISCIGAYRQYKLCNTNVSTCLFWAWDGCWLTFLWGGSEDVEGSKTWFSRPCFWNFFGGRSAERRKKEIKGKHCFGNKRNPLSNYLFHGVTKTPLFLKLLVLLER